MLRPSPQTPPVQKSSPSLAMINNLSTMWHYISEIAKTLLNTTNPSMLNGSPQILFPTPVTHLSKSGPFTLISSNLTIILIKNNLFGADLSKIQKKVRLLDNPSKSCKEKRMRFKYVPHQRLISLEMPKSSFQPTANNGNQLTPKSSSSTGQR